jgi:molybdopterin-containing oxidoreductase family membrane subunit
MATTTKQRTTPNTMPSLIGLGILVIIGIIAWVVQLTKGMSVIGVGQAIVWGVYITTFFFMAGLGGGLVILAALGDLEIIPGLKSLLRSLLIAAIAAYVAAGLMILMDIGRPLRVLNMIFSANLTSPFVWDFASLAVSVIVAAIYLFAAPKGKWFPTLAAIVAGLVIVIEGWILSMTAGVSMWHGGMTPVIFLVEGLLSASAILLIAKVEDAASQWLRRTMLVLLPVLVLLNLFEIASVSYAGEPEAQAATSLMLASPIFWLVLLVGIVVPFVLLAWWGSKKQAVITSGVLVLLAVFASKNLLLVSGQALPYMRSPETYAPTLVEIGGVVGIFGLAGLIYLLGLPLVQPKKAS